MSPLTRREFLGTYAAGLGAPAASAEGVSSRGLETGSCVYAVGSGRYKFSVDPLPRVLSARVNP